MLFHYDDGGRSRYYKAKNVSDCVTRAVAIATGKDYKEVYDDLNRLAKSERKGTKKRFISNSREGVAKRTSRKYLDSIGWSFKPLMSIGSGCKVHLSDEDLEANGLDYGTYILKLSKHLTVIKDGVIYDTYDPSRDGERCIYGYYYKRASFEDSKNRAETVRARLEEA